MKNTKWYSLLSKEYEKEYFVNLQNFVRNEYKNKTIFPPASSVFKALELSDYDKVKVVILGQDPYHGIGEAQGLSFSVPVDVRRPPSLRNIFVELENDLGIKRDKNDLSDWASQGVLLLNSILTVQMDTPLSHKDKGWEVFTDEIIKLVNKKETPVVFILWGSYARSKKVLIDNPIHYVIESVHPSPLSASRGFFGSKPFSKTNNFLEKNKIEGIKW
ncbi:MAG: uracil-DNA glycosylase [Bacilli bacterium]|nr:uracil-DNA glycosylase [Bacilli bacterium]